MHSKLAGHLPLQAMIANVIDSARVKLAEANETKKEEKKEHGGKLPSAKAEKREEEKEKESSIDYLNPSHVEKLASALDTVADSFFKMADSVENGGESSQGGQQLPTASPVGGTQPYKKDGSKKHQVPMSTGLQTSSDNPGSNQVPNDANKAPGGANYPAKGVLKTAGQSVLAKIEQVKIAKSLPPALAENASKVRASQDPDKPGAEKPDLGAPGKKDEDEEDKKKESAAAVNFILSRLDKVAETSQGGMTLDSASGQGPKPESGAKGGNEARSHIESNSAATNMKKVEGKKPQKRMLSEVLTEPALTSSTDSKVQENLRNASKGGVKIAAARALLQKIASDPNDPRHEKLKEAMKRAGKKEKASQGIGASMPSPMPSGGGLPPTPGM